MVQGSIACALVAGLTPLTLQAGGRGTLPLPRPVPGPVRDAGIYHAGTDTWTRKATLANLGPEVVYDNTLASGYFNPLSGAYLTDEGRLPSPSSPTSPTSRPGCATSYTIDGVQYGYCTDQPGGGAWTLRFFEHVPLCTGTLALPPSGIASVPGPGASAQGVVSCWIVTIDLASSPTGSFVLQADGNGTYAGADTTNLFGWSMSVGVLPFQQLSTGPLISGDPNLAQQFDGTVWDNPVNYQEAGTGMSTQNSFFVEAGLGTPGCYWFGAAPYASFHLELYAEACPSTPSVTTFCFGDGTGAACPCGNQGLAGHGCANSLFAAGASLSVTGAASLTNDTLLLASDHTPDTSVLFFQGTTRHVGGVGAAFGDGKRCAGGTALRLATRTAAGNIATYPGVGDPSVSSRGLVTAPGTRTYQAWYRNAAAFCTSATFNLSNGCEIGWVP